jgi:hypothetical protein
VYKEIDIHSRNLLIDRIQLSVIPSYSYLINNVKCNDLKILIIKNRKEKGFDFKRFTSNDKLYYQVVLPDFDDLPFISDIKVSAFVPFTVSFKLNFIRLLRSKIKVFDNFRFDYDKDILLDEDNYLNYENWPYWDNNKICDLINELKFICIDVANKSLNKIVYDNNLVYEKVTVSQIETNVDYFVGVNNSFYMMDKFCSFIGSDKGKDFRDYIKEIGINCRLPDYDKEFDPTKFNKNESFSIQFQINEGVFLKIYRKDRDHIRAELSFNKSVLEKKFKVKNIINGKNKISKSRDIDRIVKSVCEFSKNYFKKLDLENLFIDIMSDKCNLKVVNQLSILNDFFNISDPRMLPIIDNVLNGLPVKDPDSIRLLQRNKNYGNNFVRSYDLYGNWFYNYDPVEAQRRRINKVKNGYKMKNKENNNFLRGVTKIHYKGNEIFYFDKFGNVKNIKK